MKNVFDAEGELREVDPLAALVTCWREKTSGSLRFTRGGSRCGFDLDEGDVVAVVSSDPRFETSAILVRAGKLAADAVERLAAPGTDPALAALQTGLLTRREWKWGEKIRSIEVLSDLLSWHDGQYQWETTARPGSGDLRLPVPRLLLELFLRSRDQNLIDHQLGPPDDALARSEFFDAEFPSFGLTADAESVVRLIDGRSTAAEIAEKAPAEEFAVRKLLAALVTLGLVRPVSAAAPAPEERFPPRFEEAEPAMPAAEPLDDADSEPEAAPVQVDSALEEPIEPAPETVEAAPSETGRDLGDWAPAGSPNLDRFESPEPAETWRQPEAPVLESQAESDGRRASPLAWALGILAAAVAGFIGWRALGGRVGSTTTRARPTPVAAVTFPPPATAVAVEPAQERPTAPATMAPTAAPAAETARQSGSRSVAAATARPAASKPIGKPTPAALPAVAEAAPESREAWVRRAERDRRRLESDRRTRYAIQLELVCEVASLQEAWRHDQGQMMWLLAVSHGGRDCFRVFWGRYASIDAAKKGKAAVPSYFVTSRNHPAVVSVR
ncbi:MAG TPA: DUF4388 domain-containing protein [Thermoanaerobaculia bacterium]|nr:DUF4388 domain-containing protein [Thermoanaerobaculia bacterium]